MNRRYTTAQFKESVQALRAAFGNPAVTTDVIVGFPGETEEEFQATVEYLEDISLYEMHIFKYSIRKGTRAAAMKGQLTEAMKTKRSAVLLEMEARKSKEYRGQFVGQTVSVLFEEEKEIQGSKYMIGHTREYVKVAVPMVENADSKNLTNVILKVEIVGFLGEDILLAK
jgi:threonylcarbamoyladenosine tRNA methylthiotransferase MtaB